VRADTIGVFVPSVDANAVDECLDRHHVYSVSELVASTCHYPHSVSSLTTSISSLGLSALLHMFSLAVFFTVTGLTWVIPIHSFLLTG